MQGICEYLGAYEFSRFEVGRFGVGAFEFGGHFSGFRDDVLFFFKGFCGVGFFEG